MDEEKGGTAGARDKAGSAQAEARAAVPGSSRQRPYRAGRSTSKNGLSAPPEPQSRNGASSTYPAWVVPAAGARVPRVRHGADCAAAQRAQPPRPAARGRPRVHHAGPRGTRAAATSSSGCCSSPALPDQRASDYLPFFMSRLCIIQGPVVTYDL